MVTKGRYQERTLRTLTNKAAASSSALATVERRWSAQPTAAKLLTSACDEGIPWLGLGCGLGLGLGLGF